MILVAVYSVLLKFWTCGPEQCTAKVRLANDAFLFFSVWQRSWLHPDLILTSSRRHAALRSRRSAKSTQWRAARREEARDWAARSDSIISARRWRGTGNKKKKKKRAIAVQSLNRSDTKQQFSCYFLVFSYFLFFLLFLFDFLLQAKDPGTRFGCPAT
ncbi:hypothetical protein CPSG_02236 [Coccidioides posadasii str. Silveira]|uniref:Uncharacterized protein n=1 Tax=Coccidioides posadasii (strain RMSCC 757 / Silveira) TaxID=443226 RepID=E9CV80_COCPS|nr:hypothetical protein CPSG_02236 [Coccidioides posadasii str. Silveira]